MYIILYIYIVLPRAKPPYHLSITSDDLPIANLLVVSLERPLTYLNPFSKTFVERVMYMTNMTLILLYLEPLHSGFFIVFLHYCWLHSK